SELKERIAAGQVAEVRIGATAIEAVPRDTVETGVRGWRSTPVPFPDEDLIPLLEQHDVAYQGVLQGWISQAFIWLLPLGVILAFWVIILRRMNPTQGVLTVGKSRARIIGEEGT